MQLKPLHKTSGPRIGARDAQGATSATGELQAGLHSTFNDAPEGAFAAPQPYVAAWPGWAKLAVLVGACALSWGGVIGAAMLFASPRGPGPGAERAHQARGRPREIGALAARTPVLRPADQLGNGPKPGS